jgi:hypothetical protein
MRLKVKLLFGGDIVDSDRIPPEGAERQQFLVVSAAYETPPYRSISGMVFQQLQPAYSTCTSTLRLGFTIS